MKKRAKIITTIASLCLAIALMAFGVYAANNVTLTVNSKVDFVVEDVFVVVTGKAYLSTGATENADLVPVSGNVLANSFEAQSYQGTIGENATVFGTLKTYANSTWTDNASWDFGTIRFTSGKNVVTYVITIANSDTVNPVYVDVSLPTNGETTEAWAAAHITPAAKYSVPNVGEGANAPKSDVAIAAAITDQIVQAGKTMTITVSYTLNDFSTAISTALDSLESLTINIAHTAAA